MDISFLKTIPLRHYPWFLNIQFMNLLLPLISFPYVLRTVGPEKYGIIAAAFSLSAVLTTVTEYGISFTGVRDISRIAGSAEKISRYLSEALYARLFVYILCCLLLSPVVVFVPLLSQNAMLFLLAVAVILPSMFFPQWLYAGLLAVRQYNVMLLFNKVLSLILIFAFITKESDYVYYPLVHLVPALLSAGISVRHLRRRGISLHSVSLNVLRARLRSEFFPFVSQGLTALYAQMNPILLILAIPDAVLVGYYAVAEKIVVMAKSVLSPLNQSYLPIISRVFSISVPQGFNDAKNFALFAGGIAFLGAAALNIFAVPIVAVIGGEQFSPAVTTVRILSPILFMIALNNIAGVQVLLNLDRNREFLFGIVSGAAVHFILLFILIPYLSFHSPAVSWVTSEMTVLALFSFFVVRQYHTVTRA